MSSEPFSNYLNEINKAYQRGDATEHTHRPSWKVLIEALDKRITATNAPKRIKCSAPDYVVSRRKKSLDRILAHLIKNLSIEHDDFDILPVFTRHGGWGRVLFITGAGLSADSGLPTYRGIVGLYDHQTTNEGIPIEEALSGQMMARHPEIIWKYLARIIQSCLGAKCNLGHAVIAEMERHFERVWVLTQNVDGFHRDAGSQNVIDIHGNIHDLRCTGCNFRQRLEELTNLPIPPRCPECGQVVRPDVVLFGEMLPMEKIELLEGELQEGFSIIFSVGTTSVFPYIAAPIWKAQHTDTTTVEINPGESEVSPLVDFTLTAPAAQTLDAIWTKYQEK